MSKERYQTRLDPDTAAAVDDYADRHGVTEAEAVRRLVAAGLDVEQDDTLDPGEIRADLREIRGAVERLEDAQDDDENSSERVVTMEQWPARAIGTAALTGALGFYLGTLAPF
jgi:Fe-S-cluster formation regulator IscX/YfhJ